MKKTLFLLLPALMILALVGFGPVAAQDDSYVIGVSNGFVGSEWRTQMIQNMEDVVAEFAEKGIAIELVIDDQSFSRRSIAACARERGSVVVRTHQGASWWSRPVQPIGFEVQRLLASAATSSEAWQQELTAQLEARSALDGSRMVLRSRP